MILRSVKRPLKRLLRSAGIEVRRTGSVNRATSVGDMRALLEQLRGQGFAPTQILDVGGHRGTWSQLALDIFTGARTFLIEPQLEHEPALQAFCAAHPGSTYRLAGAGAQPGELTLNLWDDLAGTSFLSPREGAKTRTVPVLTVDTLLAEGLAAPQLVKIDVQGFELEVLRGATKLFGATEAFIVETSLYEFMPGMPLFHEVVAFFAARDYVPYDFPGFLRRPSDGALGQLDVCFVQAKGRFRRSSAW